MITNKDLCLLVSGLETITDPNDIPSMTAKIIPGKERATSLLMTCCEKVDSESLSRELHKVQRETLASWESHAKRIAGSLSAKELSFVISDLQRNDSSHSYVCDLATTVPSRITLCNALEKYSTETGFIHMVEECAATLADMFRRKQLFLLLRTCPKENITIDILNEISTLRGNTAAINTIGCCIDSKGSIATLMSILSLNINNSSDLSVHDLHVISDDVSGSVYSDNALKESFQLFEKNSADGTLSKSEFRKLYLSLEWCGLEPSDREIEKIFKSSARGDAMTFDDYCVAMLKRAKM